MASDREQLTGLRELSSSLLQHGDDVDIASLSGRLRAQRRRLESIQARHDVSVCSVRFRPSTSMSTEDRANVLGKLIILDVGKLRCCTAVLMNVYKHFWHWTRWLKIIRSYCYNVTVRKPKSPSTIIVRVHCMRVCAPLVFVPPAHGFLRTLQFNI